MSGPYPYPDARYPESLPQQGFPVPAAPGAPAAPGQYPGALPPPVDYPRTPRRRKWVWIGLALLAVIAGVAAVIVVAARGGTGGESAVLNDDTAAAAIQDYLDALAQGKDERIAEHASCGMWDAITDPQADMALANLASDAFRRQWSSVDVEKIDKIVTWSPNQAQVLFTMKAKEAGRGGAEVERQAVAQLLVQQDEVLVCSYLPRNAGPI